MMLTNVIAVPVAITHRGQKDVERILGVETSITALSGITLPEITGRQVAGLFRLQAEGIANQCYSTQVYMGTGNLDTVQPGFNPAYTAWQQYPYIGGYNREPEIVDLPHTHLLYGSFTDIYGKRISRDLVYTAMLYLWTERKDN
jgi:hypothetical protein